MVQTITVEDTIAPEFVEIIPEDLTVSCSEIPEADVLTALDNCSVSVDVEFFETSTYDPDVNEDYQIIRTWITSDECGNSQIIEQFIDVIATETITNLQGERCVTEGIIDLNEFLENEDDNSNWQVVTNGVTLNDNFLDPTDLQLGDYVFTYSITNDTGCVSTQELTLNINDSCGVLSCNDPEISVTVTPNGDAHNQFFTISNIESCGYIIDLKILNRWGALIYESSNYQNDWSGETPNSSVGNSGKVPSGTYYYIINLLNSGSEPYTGAIYVGTN